MKKTFSILLGILFLLTVGILPVAAEERYFPTKNGNGTIGKVDRNWRMGYFNQFSMPEISAPSGNPAANTGWLYVKDNGAVSSLYFESDDGTVSNLLTVPGFALTADADAGDFDIKSLDRLEFLDAAGVATMTAANAVNKGIRLYNTGDGEFGGNASNDTAMTIKISYRVRGSGL